MKSQQTIAVSKLETFFSTTEIQFDWRLEFNSQSDGILQLFDLI